MLFATVMCLNLASAQNQSEQKMIGNIRVIIRNGKTLIFRNSYCGGGVGKLQAFQKGTSDVLFTNLSEQALDDAALLNDLSKTSAHDAFWLDGFRCIFENNWKERKTVVLASGSIQPCDVATEASRLYGIPVNSWFLGRSNQFVFWSTGPILFRKNFRNGVVEQVRCPNYVEKISGASELPDGKLLLFASGKNPNFFHGHPGWSGILSLDFSTKKFERIK